MKDIAPVCYFMPTALSSLLHFEKDVAVPFDEILSRMLHYIHVRNLLRADDKYTINPNADLATVFGDNTIRIVDMPELLKSKLQVVVLSG